ncbi:MAG: EF-P lysine aminoacylase GenX [Bdellovibrionales bacterium]|nr:EF-P lysine aminoacylase GenX [Bdellovibrionales bacterium]
MLYSLSRFRFHKPVPPFELGGEYLGREGQHYLRDALGSVELEGPETLFKGLSDGDLVVVKVKRADEFNVLAEALDIYVKSEAPTNIPPKPHAARFAVFLSRVRDFFVTRGFNEVLTPSLVRCPGLEPSLEPFATEANYGRLRETVYLPTSPEIHLKKAMAAGWTDIFELKSCFRRGEFSSHHDNEFTMLEWYRGFAGLKMIEDDLRGLVQVLADEGWSTTAPQIQVTDFAALFRTHLGFALTPQTNAAELLNLCQQLNVHTTADDSFNDLFHRLLVDRLESEIAEMGPVIVKRFPPSQAALAKLDKDGWADRFEFYWNGLEIANAFNEVNGADEQKQRWADEQRERLRLGSSAVPADPGLIRALRKGMPPSGGIALGVERLYMACAGVIDIRELKLFSVAEVFER